MKKKMILRPNLNIAEIEEWAKLSDEQINMNKIKKAHRICHDCAINNGAKWPEGHCATVAMDDTCDVCSKIKDCAAVNDWDWADTNLSKGREL